MSMRGASHIWAEQGSTAGAPAGRRRDMLPATMSDPTQDPSPLRCATGYSEALEDSFAAGQEAAEMARGRLRLGARTVAVLLCSVEFDLAEVLRGVRAVLDVPLLGCTTYSEGTEDGYRDDSVSLLLLSGDGLEFGLGLGEHLAADAPGGAAAAWDAARAALGGEPRLAIAFPDASLCMMGEAVMDALDRLSAALPGGRIPIFGGCPGDGGVFQKTYQFFGGAVHSDSLPLLLLGGDVEAHVVSRTGWRPMGAPGTVTRAAQGRLQQVDGKPAVAFVCRYVPEVTEPRVLASFPVSLVDEGVQHEGHDYHVIRSPFFYDAATDSIAYAGNVPEGGSIQLGRVTRELTLGSLDHAVEALRARQGGRRPLCLLFASCGARKLMLGLDVLEEARRLRGALGAETPMAGFYSYGELGAFDSAEPALARPRYHNASLVLCALYARERATGDG
jgi:hypothetical protein